MNLIWFSPIGWRSYPQRPHFMMRSLMKQGVKRVIWVEPYPSRLPRLGDWRRTPSLIDQQTPLLPDISIIKPAAIPAEPWPLVRALNEQLFWKRLVLKLAARCREPYVLGIGKPSALAAYALANLCPAASFFDAMDDFPEFYQGISRRSMQKYENFIAREVDVLLVSSSGLQEKYVELGCPPQLILNGCAADSLPHGLPTESLPPHVGYIGSIAAWFDWEKVIALAQALPNVPVTLVGPCFAPPPQKLPDNIRLHPACDHPRAMEHLRTFTLGLLPFRKTCLTERVDPIKYYEYAGMGIPVLSTRFGEMKLRGEADGTFFFEDYREIAELVTRAMAYRPDPGKIDALRRQADWSQRFDGLLQRILH